MADTIRRIIYDTSSASKAAADNDRVAGSIKKVDAASSDYITTAAKMAAGYFSAQGLLSAGKYAIDQALEAEAGEKRLTVALGHKSRALVDYAAARQKATTFDDDATVAAMASLAAFTKNETAIRSLINATQDMAEAKGMDLVTTADLVGKTFGSTTNALARYGIEVTGAAGSTERLDSITKGLLDRWGGQAVGATETYIGQLKQIKNETDDAMQSVGEFLLRTGAAVARFGKDTAEGFDVTREFMAFSGMMDRNVVPAIDSFISAAFDPHFGGDDFKGIKGELKFISDAFKESAPIIEDEAAKTAKAIRDYRETHRPSGDMGPNIDPDLLDFRNQRADLYRQQKEDRIKAEKEAEEAILVKLFDSFSAREDYRRQDEEGWKRTADLRIAEEQRAADATLISLDRTKAGMEAERAKYIQRARDAKDKTEQEIQDGADLILLEERKQRAQFATGRQALSNFASANAAFKGSEQVTKRFMQAEALMATYDAANKAYAAMAGIPVVGPALGIAAAAAAVASGLANVAQIQAAKFARGGDFVTSGPQLIMVGDNPGGREHVQITPKSSPNFDGPQGAVHIHFHGPVTSERWVNDTLVPTIEKRLNRRLA